jgi:hypothetical protein
MINNIYRVILIGLCFLAVSFKVESAAVEEKKSEKNIYADMLSYAEKGENNQVLALLASLKNRIAAIEKNYKINFDVRLKEAIQKSKKEVIKTIYALAYYDMKDTFNTILNEIKSKEDVSVSDLKNKLKYAYQCYLAASPILEETDFEGNKEAKRAILIIFNRDLQNAVSSKDISELEKKFLLIENVYNKNLKIEIAESSTK